MTVPEDGAQRASIRRSVRLTVFSLVAALVVSVEAMANPPDTSAAGMKVVALCDTWEERLREAGRRHGVETYTDFNAFLAHDMDAVVLANYFHEHAPFAGKALQAGKHVMSETAACISGQKPALGLCTAGWLADGSSCATVCRRKTSGAVKEPRSDNRYVPPMTK